MLGTKDSKASNTKIVGAEAPRVDAVAKVTGEALYAGDLKLDGMLYMKILFAGRPHARIKRLEISQAEAYPGVVAVFSAEDVPVNEYGLQIKDQPVLCGKVVRFVGDQVAVVVAETEKAAAAARDLIEVEYEFLPTLTGPHQAMEPGAYAIHADRPDNLICHYKIRKGDVETAFDQADVIVEGEYQTPVQEHAYLEPEAGLAYVDEAGRVTVEAAGQWTHTDREQIAHALDLPADQVRVIYPAIGGAFGGREDMSVQIVLALAAWRLQRPVKIIWSREESIVGHGKRHAMTIRYKSGATREGKLVAAQVEMIADGGAYCYTTNKVLGNATVTCTGPYAIPNVRVDTYGVYTNNLPGAAFRGFGAPQALFAAEMQLNKLAEALDVDPVELRWRNALRQGDTLSVGTPPPGGVTVAETVEAAAQAAVWQRGGQPPRWRRVERQRDEADDVFPVARGWGFAAGFKNTGFSFGYQENCHAKIALHGETEIDEVVLYYAGAEVGQGLHTVAAQVAAEVVGVPLDKVRLVLSDTATTGDAGSASASRSAFMGGNAIQGAAINALEAWQQEDRPAIGEHTYLAPPTEPFDPETGQCTPNFSYGYVAQAVEVEVDVETGLVQVLRVVSANDVGKALNPQNVRGQIEGAVVQAQGWTLQENFQQQGGQVQSRLMSTYLIPTVLDIPQALEPLILEFPDPEGPWGARGMGEMPFLPLAPAIVAALHDATGVWFDQFPLTPERVALGLLKRGTRV